MFLSVVVFSYNQEKFISQTLDSIIEQKHDFSYEIIIGDDYSVDGTRNILLQYKEKFPSIIKLILNEKNMGMIGNFFNVMNHCTGKYVMVCAGDDYWLPGKVKSQIIFMENNTDVGMCCGNVQKLFLNGKMTATDSPEGPRSIEYLIKRYDMDAVTICLRKNLFLEYIKFIEPTRKNWPMEDYPMCLWFAINSKIYCLSEVLAVYRLSANSITRPYDYNKRKQFQSKSTEVKYFFIDLYKIPFSREDLQNQENLFSAYTALNYKKYDEYRLYISKISSRDVKTNIKKIIGKCRFLAILFHHYVKFRSK